MKSSLGITHPVNLCTIAEIYRLRVICLLLIVSCVSLHSLMHNELRKKLMTLCVTVVQIKVIKIGTNRGSPYANYYYSPLL